ncbi:hypothetical protein JCM8097_006851 [Rhodosporidiobolus ruineniae]
MSSSSPTADGYGITFSSIDAAATLLQQSLKEAQRDTAHKRRHGFFVLTGPAALLLWINHLGSFRPSDIAALLRAYLYPQIMMSFSPFLALPIRTRNELGAVRGILRAPLIQYTGLDLVRGRIVDYTICVDCRPGFPPSSATSYHLAMHDGSPPTVAQAARLPWLFCEALVHLRSAGSPRLARPDVFRPSFTGPSVDVLASSIAYLHLLDYACQSQPFLAAEIAQAIPRPAPKELCVAVDWILRRNDVELARLVQHPKSSLQPLYQYLPSQAPSPTDVDYVGVLFRAQQFAQGVASVILPAPQPAAGGFRAPSPARAPSRPVLPVRSATPPPFASSSATVPSLTRRLSGLKLGHPSGDPPRPPSPARPFGLSSSSASTARPPIRRPSLSSLSSTSTRPAPAAVQPIASISRAQVFPSSRTTAPPLPSAAGVAYGRAPSPARKTALVRRGSTTGIREVSPALRRKASGQW